MPEVKILTESDLAVIFTEIGRGHPSYLDGLLSRFDIAYPELRYFRTDVFEISSGTTLRLWKLIRWLYRFGARGGPVTRLYSFLRGAAGRTGGGGRLLRIIGRDIRLLLRNYDRPVLVAHPLLAGVLSDQNRVIYQHGEIAAPVEALVRGCEKILVPLKETANAFEQSGVPPSDLLITGQCIESELAHGAGTISQKRLQRLAGNQSLTVALFSSGAYPAEHLAKMRLMALSLFHAGHSVFLFLGQDRQIADKMARSLAGSGLPTKPGLDFGERLKLIVSRNRLHENRLVADIFADIDLFAAPAHERTNWSVGMGLPMLILCPHIGSYAPQNTAFALARKTAFEIKDNKMAGRIAELIHHWRQSGELYQMALNGFGHTDIDGFTRAAEFLAKLKQAPNIVN